MKLPHGERVRRIRAALAEGPKDTYTLATLVASNERNGALTALNYLRHLGEAECIQKGGKGRGNRKPAIWRAVNKQNNSGLPPRASKLSSGCATGRARLEPGSDDRQPFHLTSGAGIAGIRCATHRMF